MTDGTQKKVITREEALASKRAEELSKKKKVVKREVKKEVKVAEKAVDDDSPKTELEIQTASYRRELARYVEAMEPGKIVQKNVLAARQSALFSTIIRVIRNTPIVDSNAIIETILESFKVEPALGTSYVFRGLINQKTGKELLPKYAMGMYALFISTNDPEKRILAVNYSVSVEKAIAGSPSSVAARLLNFYNQ